MNVSATKLFPHPGYENHIAMNLNTDAGGQVSLQELQNSIKSFKLAPGTEMKDIEIPGTEEGQQLKLRVITPAGLPENSPVILDIHGGGWVSGGLDIENYRNVYLAEHTPCIVVSVEYRLATRETPFPAQLLDCRTAYLWLRENAAQLGGDPERIGVHGTSAGGNLAAALALYLRDHGERQAELTVINCPATTMAMTNSKRQFGMLSPAPEYAQSAESIYMNVNGEPKSYYTMPGFCPDFKYLKPHMVVVAEYDPLRDEGLSYALRLLEDGVPCEIICAPRVTHGFCVVDQPLTRWTHNGICAAFRREFGMPIIDY